ncbi:TetR/AcrR family transcriptional regulator [Paraburkholderia tuberum]|uniref:Transcriptional regulator, TetR family n=1 Tax=Paraburkholderia tuberum TaxID=157910 RepID=A0A1H1JFM4_9BURK|nr:TetR/AcrR family transcriptional regulator [Paraburkholderia tuberum]SDR48703.1 transcriptional regulator, TetR family [Paraburkholderia tuberum]
MKTLDHRPRVAAERRERMRARLLKSALRLVAEKGPASTSIDDVISAAEVSRGTFYKYFASPEALIRELAGTVANELIAFAEPVVLQSEDPAERIACGIRLVSRLALHYPVVASFLVRVSWPDAQGPGLLLDFARRDLANGIRTNRFRPMPLALALNVVAGAVLGATHSMLQPGCDPDFAEQSAAAALRALGLPGKTADRLATRALPTLASFPTGLMSEVLNQPATAEENTVRRRGVTA